MSVTPEEFVVTYMKHKNVHETAQALGMTYPNAYARLKSYRKAGVKLPIARRMAPRIDIAGLNEIIKNNR